MSFHEEMETLAKKLKQNGHEVKAPLLRVEVKNAGKNIKMSIRNLIEERGGVDAFENNHPIWDEKSVAIDNHFKEVEWCDAIIVANYKKHNIEGYIGGNVLIEMGLARYLRKKIYVLFPVSSELSYKEEILGMRPTIINNDITLVGK